MASGFRDLERLRREPALAALRNRGGFQELVQELERTRALEAVNLNVPGTGVDVSRGSTTPGAEGGSARAVADIEGKILAVREEAARDRPDDPARRAELARSRFAIGLSRLGFGNVTQAFPSLDRARDMQETLVREQPRKLRHRLDLSATHTTLAALHIRYGRLAAAQKSWRRSIEVLEGADRTTAAGLGRDLDRALAEAHLQAGRGYSSLQLWREAAAEFTTSFQFAEPADPDHWTHYGCLLGVLEDDDAAARLAGRMLDRYGRTTDADAWSRSVATALALRPGSSAEIARLLEIAEPAKNAGAEDFWTSIAIAMAELRAGRFDVVIKILESCALSLIRPFRPTQIEPGAPPLLARRWPGRCWRSPMPGWDITMRRFAGLMEPIHTSAVAPSEAQTGPTSTSWQGHRGTIGLRSWFSAGRPGIQSAAKCRPKTRVRGSPPAPFERRWAWSRRPVLISRRSSPIQGCATSLRPGSN